MPHRALPILPNHEQVTEVIDEHLHFLVVVDHIRVFSEQSTIKEDWLDAYLYAKPQEIIIDQ
jgi:hypothetical protein